MSGGTIAVIIMAVLAVLGLVGIFLLRCSRQSRHPIPHPAGVVVVNQAFLVNNTDGRERAGSVVVHVEERARTGNAVVTTADQVQYLIPMVEQAPDEYLVPVTRNEDYTYAPPMQPPAEYAAIDESGNTINETAKKERNLMAANNIGKTGGGGRKEKSGGGKDLDLNGYVVDESSAPVKAESGTDRAGAGTDETGAVAAVTSGGDGVGAGAGDLTLDGGNRNNENVVYGASDAAGNTVYTSAEGSGATDAAVYGTPAEYGAIEGVYGDDPYAANEVAGVSGGIQRHSEARQGSVYTGFEGMDQDTEETDI
jgi:hypothetical protein